MKTGIPWYKRVDNLIMHFEHIIIGSGMLFISTIMIINTLMRYILNNSWTWADEISRYMVAWIAFVGSASCIRFGAHPIVDIIPQYLKGKVRLIYDTVMGTACALFAVFLVQMGWAGFRSSVRLGNVSVLTGLPIWTIFLGVALGLTLLCYNYFRSTIISIINLKKPVSPEPDNKEAQI